MTALPPGPRPPKKGLGKTGCLALVGALIFFTWGMELFWTRLDERRFPWMYTKAGRSTLVGTWVGTLTSGGGKRRAVLLHIERQPLNFSTRRGRGGRGSNRMFRRAYGEKLDGHATFCGAPKEQHFTLNGSNQTMDASQFRLSFSPSDSVPPDGLAPSFMRGSWDQRDALDLEVDLYLRKGASAISSTDDPDTGRNGRVTMRRGDDAAFRALCSQMRGRLR